MAKSISRPDFVVFLATLLVVAANPARGDELNVDEQAGIDAFNQGDLINAMAYFERAADGGSALAQTRLAWILDGANDDERAVEMYRAAAEQGYAPGMHGLGEMYAKGEGVDKDFEQAVAWFTKAAEAGHAKALRLLIGAYESGELGLAPNPEKARHYRDKLAQTGDDTDDGGAN